MKLDLSDISKLVVEKGKLYTPSSTDGLANGEQTETKLKYSYAIVTVSNLGLDSMEDETSVDQSALLAAVLRSEFFDDDFSLKHLTNDSIHTAADRVDEIAGVIDSWYSDKVDQLHAEFDFLTAMRPARISDLIVVNGSALLEICQGEEETNVDFGAVDVSNDPQEADAEDEEEEEGEE